MRLVRALTAVAAAGLVACGDGPSEPSIAGDRIVYTRLLPNGSDIFAISDTGGPATQLTRLPGFATGPKTSPDGRLIAFTHELSPTQGEIYVMRADGSQGRAILETPGLVFVTGWTPDGLVLLSDFNSNAPYRFSTLQTDGTGRTPLPQFDGVDGVDFSPDGSKVAYSRFVDDGNHLFVADRDGSNPVALTAGPFQDVSPDWSPDGQWIAFASDRVIGEGNTAPWIIRPDGADARQVGSIPIFSNPLWSPDGTRLLCGLLNDPPGVDRDVIVFDVATGEPTNLTAALGGDEVLPDWAPEPR